MAIKQPAVWVIGGTSGIGAAVIKHMYFLGWGTIATGEEVDVCDIQALTDQLDKIGNFWPGQLEGVVYSAGINHLGWIGESGAIHSNHAAEQRVMEVNALGFLNVMHVLKQNMPIGQNLSVVAISSDAARRPMRTSAAYCASKAALDMIVRVSARELGPHGWRINAVSPGMVEGTGMTEYIDRLVPEIRGWSEEQALEYERSQEVVAGRIEPGEVAYVVADVLSGPRHLNGAIIELNGGR